MIVLSVMDSFYQGLACMLIIFIWYYYIIGVLRWRTVILAALLAFIWAIISVFLVDAVFFAIIAVNILSQLIRKRRLNYFQTGTLMLVNSVQILFSNIAIFIGRMMILAYAQINNGDVNSSHYLILIYIIMLIIMNATMFFVLKRRISIVIARINELNLGKPIFGMSLILFIAVEGIILLSFYKKITATIQVPLIIAFFIMMIMMLWQMYFFISSYTKKQAADYQAQQNAQLNDYLKSVERQYLELRKFKHDYKNLMLSLQDSLTNGNSPEQTEYFKELIAQSAVETSLDSGKIVKVQHLGNETLRGLIVQKFLDAQAQGINLTVELNTENFVIHHELVDIIRIVGNLLDNAIEATQATADKQIICAFNTLNGTKEISVRNPTNQKIDANKVFELGVSTKGAQRGFGLSNVHQLVAQHRNFFLDMNSQDSQVVMTLTVVEED
ncbi:sensor histidine kinase [Lactiplantibacillus pentosus]|uniref:GHKL domain-containing protein n=7 Tax=Lactiplantibacillus pentosus TaxID=1589 RepID=A0AAX6LI00_LACPE|nr:GHKL domain-containing protein [Lactiplantibacillus pentosus]AYJ40779.1 GHKL domain-containing protein [Lactiplantibacillus pentosus]MBU7497120.1 GHKL domain-containing protein [Lactiplantibacillus pentosus]MCC3161922.1 GHKL domain-containing protein [Lactiplantibacillus pentosus]MCJ8187866.1 GHKL domain-containing protein [Lactiplantibacillus pentosus]MDF2314146.1 GHKL domain-containing protein [Lactiplantibacillus pentosus]